MSTAHPVRKQRSPMRVLGPLTFVVGLFLIAIALLSIAPADDAPGTGFVAASLQCPASACDVAGDCPSLEGHEASCVQRACGMRGSYGVCLYEARG